MTVLKDRVQEKLYEFIARFGAGAARSLLKEFNAKSISQVKTEDYEELYKLVKQSLIRNTVVPRQQGPFYNPPSEPENEEIEEGDTVRVIDKGKVYNNYGSMIELMHLNVADWLSQSKYYNSPFDGDQVIVCKIREHEFDPGIKTAACFYTHGEYAGKFFLISVEGLEKVNRDVAAKKLKEVSDSVMDALDSVIDWDKIDWGKMKWKWGKCPANWDIKTAEALRDKLSSEKFTDIYNGFWRNHRVDGADPLESMIDWDNDAPANGFHPNYPMLANDGMEHITRADVELKPTEQTPQPAERPQGELRRLFRLPVPGDLK